VAAHAARDASLPLPEVLGSGITTQARALTDPASP
jgi:hypothetical protein